MDEKTIVENYNDAVEKLQRYFREQVSVALENNDIEGAIALVKRCPDKSTFASALKYIDCTSEVLR